VFIQATTVMSNTIVANNTSGDASPPDIWDNTSPATAFTSGGYNLMGVIEPTTGITPTVTDITGTLAAPANPLLGPLADHDGPTQIHMPQSGSAVIDRIPGPDYNGAPSVDQRGYVRIAPYDIGAAESDGLEPTPALLISKSNSVSPGVALVGDTVTYTIAVENLGGGDATEVVISDTLPSSVSFLGPVTLEGTTGLVATGPDDLPTLVSDATVPARSRITVTLPVEVVGAERIVNTVSVTRADYPSPLSNSTSFDSYRAVSYVDGDQGTDQPTYGGGPDAQAYKSIP
jgi:uncharacterized repeat protein (TIGR01451 family)